MITKIDYIIALLVGFLTGVFAIPTVLNLGFKNMAVLILLPWIIAPLWALGVWLGGFLSRWLSFMTQFGKFVAVGFLNTAIDFGVLNILSLASGITSGFVIGGVNIPGFGIAALNSYLWNKFWVFKKNGSEGVFHDFPVFLAITVVGVLINGGIVVLLTTFVGTLFGISPSVWLNLSKAGATAVTLIWNFMGYKFFVFRQKETNIST